MQFILRHLRERRVRAEYGFDHALGFFVHIHIGSMLTGTYDALNSEYDHERPLNGALRFMIGAGFFSEDELEEALSRMVHTTICDLPGRLRRVARVVRQFKEAAD